MINFKKLNEEHKSIAELRQGKKTISKEEEISFTDDDINKMRKLLPVEIEENKKKELQDLYMKMNRTDVETIKLFSFFYELINPLDFVKVKKFIHPIYVKGIKHQLDEYIEDSINKNVAKDKISLYILQNKGIVTQVIELGMRILKDDDESGAW